MITHIEWVDRLTRLAEMESPQEDMVELCLVEHHQPWQVRIITAANTGKNLRDPATSAKHHAEEVLHDVRRGLRDESLIGVTSTKFGRSYWGTQKSPAHK